MSLAIRVRRVIRELGLSLPWLAYSGALGIVLCFLPLVSVIGVESALALAIALPPVAAALAARSALAARGAGVSSVRLLSRCVGAGLVLLLLPLSLLALNALRVRNCAPVEGLMFIVLGPGAGVVLASIAGALFGSLPWPRRLAIAVAMALPLGSILLWLLRFYATPAIFAYGHFFGYFAGTIYDEVVAVPHALWTLRALSAAWAVGAACLLLALRDPESGRLRGAPPPGRRGLFALSLLALGIGAAGELDGAALGHHASAAHIAETLGAEHRSARCRIHHAREMPRERVARFADDCDLRVRMLERWLGVRHPRPIGVYLFRSAGEKQRLMGAAGTNLAKPWLGEIYLQDAGWPHPVLPHELAHIIAANIGTGPFRVSGPLDGFWPDLALIEGVAVAAAWAESSRSGMTPHQWTRAMLELGMVPPLDELVGAGFLSQQKRMAYTLSGSLLRFVADTLGSGTIRAIYRSGDVAAPLDITLRELEQRWHEHVRRVPLPEAGRALVEQRFAGGSILSAVCPHQKAELKGELSGLLAAGRDEPAMEIGREILDIDPAEAGTRAALVGVFARLGDAAAAETELSRLQSAPPSTRLAARQLLADEAWRAARRDEALEAYRALLAEPHDRDARRQLEVKTLGLAAGGRQEQLIFELLVGTPGVAVDGAVAMYLIRELRAERADGLAHYLEARQLYFRERYAAAADLLATARALGLPSRDLEIEALRVEAICRAAQSVGLTPELGQAAAAARLWRELRAAADVDRAIKAEASDWLRWLWLRAELAR